MHDQLEAGLSGVLAHLINTAFKKSVFLILYNVRQEKTNDTY